MDHGSVEAIDAAFPDGVDDHWHDFALRTLNRIGADDLEVWDALDQRVTPRGPIEVPLGDTPLRPRYQNAVVGLSLDIVSFTFPDDTVRQIDFSGLGFSSGELEHGRVQAWILLRDGSTRVADITESGALTFCRDEPRRRTSWRSTSSTPTAWPPAPAATSSTSHARARDGQPHELRRLQRDAHGDRDHRDRDTATAWTPSAERAKLETTVALQLVDPAHQASSSRAPGRRTPPRLPPACPSANGWGPATLSADSSTVTFDCTDTQPGPSKATPPPPASRAR